MPDNTEPAPAAALAISASTRIKDITASIPGLKGEVEGVQREILALAPDCERGDAAAKGRRKKLRAQLAELNDAIADKEAALVALQPHAAAERDQAKAANALRLALSIQALFVARDEAANKIDECLTALIAWTHECNKLGSKAIELCHRLLPENRVGWATPPDLGDWISSTLAANEIINQRHAVPRLDLKTYTIAEIAKINSNDFMGSVSAAATRASMTQSEREASEAQRRDRAAAEVVFIEQRRRVNGMRG